MKWLTEILKGLLRRTASDKIFRDKDVKYIAKNSKFDEYETGLVLMIYKFLTKNE